MNPYDPSGSPAKTGGPLPLLREVELHYAADPRPSPIYRIASSRDAIRVIEVLAPPSLTREHFIVLGLDAKNRPLGYTRFTGTTTTVGVDPADVLRPLILSNAIAFVLGHNHPSGESSPSPDDISITERIQRAASLMGINLLDHIIIAREGNFSFLDAGLMPKKGDDS